MKKTGPDSLNSWIIASACCFIHVISFSLVRLTGIFFVASISRFLVSREKASFPYTFISFIKHISGPLVGHLAHRFGVRSVTTFGCILQAVGVGACFFAEDIQIVTIFFGVIAGMGSGLGNILLPVSINQHFVKKRASAAGLSFSGASLSTFIFAPILQRLIDEYGLSGTFLILCGFLLNCIPAALLLKKPNFDVNNISKTFDNKQCEKIPKTSETLNISDNLGQGQNVTGNVVISETNGHQNYGYAEEMKEFPVNKLSQIVSIAQNKNENDPDLQCEDGTENCVGSDPVGTSGVKYDSQPMQFLHSSNNSDNNESSKISASKITCSNGKKITSKLPFLQSLIILIDPIFFLIAITSAMYTIIIVSVYTIIVDFTRDLEIQKSNEKYIYMLLAIGDLFGRLGLGWITDGGYMTPTRILALLYAMQGTVVAATAWSNGFISLGLLVTFHGVAGGGLFLYNKVIFAEYMDCDQQVIALPYSHLFCGPAVLAVSPLIGYFRDNQGSYDYIFYLLALMSFLSSFCWILAPCLAKCRKKY